MKKKAIVSAISDDQLGRMVRSVRGHKVMLDADLAALYGVPTYRLNEAVKRNSERFPEDFMFQLTWEELEGVGRFVLGFQEDVDNKELSRLKSQFAISNGVIVNNQSIGHGGTRKLPYAFTEQGVAMLSSVLRSERAVHVNIAIMRAFVSLRGMMRSQESIKHELALLKQQYKDHDEQIKAIFLMIDEIMTPPPVPKKRKIGFMRDNEE